MASATTRGCRTLMALLPLFLLLSLASGFVDLRVRAHPEVVVKQYIPQVLDGSADPPGRYRVLAPFLVEAVSHATGVSLEAAWYLTRLAWFLAAYVVFHVYLRTWFPTPIAFLGTTLLAALLPLTYTNSWPHPDHIPELALFTAGCLAAVCGRGGLFAVVLVLATFNRETSVFLVPFYLFCGAIDRRRLLKAGAFGMLWLAVFVGLRIWRGFAHYDYWQVANNLRFLNLLPAPYDPYYRAYAYFGVVLVICLSIVALSRPGNLTRPMRAGLAVVPILLVVGFTISSIIETRILTPLFPLMLPAALDRLVRSSENPAPRP